MLPTRARQFQKQFLVPGSFTIWKTFYHPRFGFVTVLVVATFRSSIDHYLGRGEKVVPVAEKLIAIYNRQAESRKKITSETVRNGRTQALHYDPMVHGSVVVDWITKMPETYRTIPKTLEMIVALMCTNNPSRFQRFMEKVQRENSWGGFLPMCFIEYCLNHESPPGCNGGSCVRWEPTFNHIVLAKKMVESLKNF